MLTPQITNQYLAILRQELIPATGCTEPIAIAYAAAKLRHTLGEVPEKILAEVSGNILKNAKSVTVPSTGGMKGIPAAIAVGVLHGDPEKELQVIADVPEHTHRETAAYIQSVPIQITCPEGAHLLDICLTGWAGQNTACVHIQDSHSNIVRIEKNGQVLLRQESSQSHTEDTGHQGMDLETILEFANTVDLTLVSPLLQRQVQYNTAIAAEGLANSWGANVGATLLKNYGNDIKVEAKAWAAAGSDARMNGCEMPVVIVSGSGNQGMTASLPVVRYAQHLGASQDQLYRALLVSDLVTVYQKAGIGRLSAYCGAVSAGVGAGAGIAYLQGADYEAIAHTITNAVAILSGTICDGAKSSCAAKIASSVDAGILGYQMYQNGRGFQSGDGIVGKDLASTVENVGILAREGMRQTDRTILEIMTR